MKAILAIQEGYPSADTGYLVLVGFIALVLVALGFWAVLLKPWQ